jgi:O-antigen ligase
MGLARPEAWWAPSLPAARPAVLVAGERADARWDPLVACLAGYILTSVGRVHQLFSVLEVLRPALLTGLVAMVLYARDPTPVRRLQELPRATTALVGALFFWMVLTIPGALSEGTSFHLVLDNFLKTALMCVITIGAVRGPRDVERLAGAYLAGTATYAAVVLSRFDPGPGEDWRLGDLYYYDANDFATLAVTAMPLGLHFLRAGHRLAVRVGAVVALAVLLVGFVRSGSRGGFIAIVAVGAFVLVRYSPIPAGRRLAAAALAAAVVAGSASEQYWEQMGTITSDADYNRTDESGRIQIWARGLGYMRDHPVFGVGAGNFQAAEGLLSPFAERQQFGVGVRWNAAHNTFIQAGAELGVPGLILFAGVIACAFLAVRRARRSGAVLAPAITASLVGFVVGAFFLSLAYSEILYTLVALAAGLQKASATDGLRVPGDE